MLLPSGFTLGITKWVAKRTRSASDFYIVGGGITDMTMIVDSNTALAATKAGKIDFNKQLPPQMTPQLIQSGEAKLANTLGILRDRKSVV